MMKKIILPGLILLSSLACSYPRENNLSIGSSIGKILSRAELIPTEISRDGVLELEFFQKGLPETNFKDFSLSVYQSGWWKPLRTIPYRIYKNKRLFNLSPATYLLECGVRNKNGDVYLQLKKIKIKPNQRVAFQVNLDVPPEKMSARDWVVRDIPQLPDNQISYLNNNQVSLGEIIKERDTLVIFFSLTDEPSARMLPMIQGVVKKTKKDVGIVGIVVGQATQGDIRQYVAEKQLEFDIYQDIDFSLTQACKLPFSTKEKKCTELPSILFINQKGAIKAWTEGYNLNIATFVEKAIELLKK